MFRSPRFAPSSCRVLHKRLSLATTAEATTSTKRPPKVALPKAIKRGPTDLLHALASTVGVDATAPHFALIDDPLTIPTRSLHAEDYVKAREFGRRAARMLATEWPTLFMTQRDEPRLETFRPTKLPDAQQLDASEDNLRMLVSSKLVSRAMELHERIRTQGKDISEGLKMDLLELLAYYNNEDPPPVEEVEWHAVRNFAESPLSPPLWKSGSIAELLYAEFTANKQAETVMIAALCKYAHADDAVQQAQTIYKEMREGGRYPGLEAYTGLLSCATTSEQLLSYLTDLRDSGGTLDARALRTAVTSAAGACNDMRRARALLAEGVRLGIAISLSTYAGLVRGCASEEARLAVIAQVIARLETQTTIPLIESTDQGFFVDAMELLATSGNRDLASRLETLYRSPANAIRLSFPFEHRFYSHYLLMLIDYLNWEELLATYRSYVPRLVGINRDLFVKISDRLQRQKEQTAPFVDLLLRVVSDTLSSGQYLRFFGRILRQLLLQIDVQRLNEEERERFVRVVNDAVNAWLELSRFGAEKESFNAPLVPQSVSLARRVIWQMRVQALEIAHLLGRIGDWPRAWHVIEMLADYDGRPVEAQQKLGSESTGERESFQMGGGMPSRATIEWLVDAAVKQGDWLNATRCIQIVERYAQMSLLRPLSEKIIAGCKLSPRQKTILENFVRLRAQ